MKRESVISIVVLAVCLLAIGSGADDKPKKAMEPLFCFPCQVGPRL